MLTDRQLLRVALLCLLACIAIAFYSTDACAQSSQPKAHLITLTAAHLADIVSTEISINSGRAREANPIAGNSRAQRIAVKSAGALVSVYLLHEIGIHHPRIARVTSYAASGVLFGVAYHNYRVSQKE